MLIGDAGEIRTHGAEKLTGFQDRLLKPLGHRTMGRGTGFEPVRQGL